ncbi:hypothetical protein A176_006859 [Myxococcus hansupus]|uniref:Uncharacterized protein n=1 Tax=Pseudomyxococcus hansupus TaxID=1297742 RepID=A0A0H4XNI5_9BACT|nr:hypothetical protein A176_006859 [Myxococcus hansupus]
MPPVRERVPVLPPHNPRALGTTPHPNAHGSAHVDAEFGTTVDDEGGLHLDEAIVTTSARARKQRKRRRLQARQVVPPARGRGRWGGRRRFLGQGRLRGPPRPGQQDKQQQHGQTPSLPVHTRLPCVPRNEARETHVSRSDSRLAPGRQKTQSG